MDSFCMGACALNLFMFKYGVSNETVEGFMKTAVENGYVDANGNLNASFSRAFAEYAGIKEYVEYSSTKNKLTPEEFAASRYEYGLGMFNKTNKKDDEKYHYMGSTEKAYYTNFTTYLG